MASRGHSWDVLGLKFVAKLCLFFGLLVSAAYFSPIGILEFVTYGQSDNSDGIAGSSLKEMSKSRRLRLALDASRLLELAVQNQILESAVIDRANLDNSVPGEGKFVAFDLSSMKAFMYNDGVVKSSFDILSKGKPGSHWETPAGLYEILYKEPQHFSSIGEVYMPYSMQFYGNYFIHGWPYYPDGTPVPEGYSGGCIRLSSDDARTLYTFAEKGTRLFVYDEPDDFALSEKDVVKVRNVNTPDISAKSFIIADIDTGAVLLEHKSEEAKPIASITKLMTALVANETISFGNVIVVEDPTSSTEGDYGSVRKGEKFVIGDALHPLLLESNNAIAHSMARYYGQASFIKWMNNKAKALGMTRTKFDDSSGLSSNNVSSARDLYLLARYLNNHKSFIFSISRERLKRVTSETGKSYEFKNFNNFAGDSNFIGGKTGFTDTARETMLSVFDVAHQYSTSTIAVIILGSEDRDGDTRALLKWYTSAAVEI